MLKRILITLLFAVIAAAPASAMRMQMPPGKWWNNPEVSARLNLSEKEKSLLDQKFIESRRQLIQLKSDVESQRFELEVVLDDHTLDEAKAMQQFKRLEASRSKLTEEMFRFVLEVRKIVGADRFQTLKEAHKQYRGAKRKGDKGRRGKPGPRHGGPGNDITD